jgi:G:T-mismatch repair DNA endonuclease (very short patch repair protein)
LAQLRRHPDGGREAIKIKEEGGEEPGRAARGWKIATAWECEIKKIGLLARARNFLNQ